MASVTELVRNRKDGYLEAVAAMEASHAELLEVVRGLLLNAPAPAGIKSDYSYILYREAAKKALARREFLIICPTDTS